MGNGPHTPPPEEPLPKIFNQVFLVDLGGKLPMEELTGFKRLARCLSLKEGPISRLSQEAPAHHQENLGLHDGQSG